MSAQGPRRRNYRKQAHLSFGEAVLKIAVVVAAFAGVLVAVPAHARTPALIVMFLGFLAVIVTNTYIGGFFAGRSIWRVNVLFTEPIDYHKWNPLDEIETVNITQQMGIERVESVFRCKDCDDLQIRAVDASGAEFVAFKGAYTADGMRVGVFVRFAKFTPFGQGTRNEVQLASTQD